MPQFYIMFIQGSDFIKAAGNGDTATMERLLKRNPHLINYKGLVRRVNGRSIILTCMLRAIISIFSPGSYTNIYPPAFSADDSLNDET